MTIVCNMNDLLGIKLICLRSELNVRLVRLVAIKNAFFIALSLYPLSFFANTPFKEKVEMVVVK